MSCGVDWRVRVRQDTRIAGGAVSMSSERYRTIARRMSLWARHSVCTAFFGILNISPE